ncbi:thioredoxin-like protein [Pyrenochaeta sp. DS3sAY3a]|nr:thioredoxin-like protein [Pyrenochaeta sp. DS3sAY3a]
MTYESTITFTFDTICPWTYLAYTRLTRALSTHRTTNPSSPASFTLTLAPYQLYPDFGAPVPKREWYASTKYNDDAARMDMYEKHMTQLFAAEGLVFNFGEGDVGNTLHAHRILCWAQEERGSEVACKVLEGLYVGYFSEGKAPAAEETLAGALVGAGVPEGEARRVVGDEGLGVGEVRRRIGVQRADGVDGVPVVRVEGRKRDFTLTGAKEEGEYEKVLRQVERECV